MQWGPEAFAKAKRENKPIFVSIGYSTCYWCHVMERQSFEDEDVAKVLNDKYVAIKVDREERPDIDEQLMLATQLMTGRGGWPNSVWLTVDGRPWMAGTYFPKSQFISALEQLSAAWKEQPENVEKQAKALSAAIREAAQASLTASEVLEASNSTEGPRDSALDIAYEQLASIYDPKHGGFGKRPKFPPHGMLRLLVLKAHSGEAHAVDMLTHTLDAMWCGGVHDHVGGGFHRYSTDESWLLPHFEKMLYDNAQLMRAYAEAYELLAKTDPAKASLYRTAVADIFAWLQREMTSSQGAFYSAIDSESEDGEEGKFYTWSTNELTEVLGEKEANWYAKEFQFRDEGNFKEESTGKLAGVNIPHFSRAQLASQNQARISELHQELYEARQQREHPHLDDKIIAAWNGLMISSLAHAGRVLEEPKYIEAASRAANFVLSHLRNDDGRLLRTWRASQKGKPGYLNDYAFLAEGLHELHRATGSPEWLTKTKLLVDEMRTLFEDPSGGFFFTSLEHEDLLLRSKNLSGGGNLPTGNGVAMQVLVALAFEAPEYLESAERGLRSFDNLMRSSPQQAEHLVLADEILKRFKENEANAKTSKANSPQNEGGKSFQSTAIQGQVTLDKREAKAGELVTVTVELTVAKGYHIYTPNSPSEVSFPASVELEVPANWQQGDLSFPEGKQYRQEGLEETVEIHEGSIHYQLPVRIPQSQPQGEYQIKVKLKYQACEDNLCLQPQTVDRALEIRVTE